MSKPCEDQWRRRAGSSPFSAAVTFGANALVLGRGTVLRSLGSESSHAVALRIDAGHDRMVALLATAAHGHLSKHALLQLEAALGDWRRGDRGLAAIRLAFARLPRLQGDDDAYRLFLAETALDAGVTSNELLRKLGYLACAALLKFNPSQPRVPAGSGRRGGQWTSGDAAAEASGSASQLVSPESAPTGSGPADRGGGFIPVFLRPQPDGEDEVIQDKERRFFREPNEEERVEDGRILDPPLPGPIGPGSAPDLGLDEPVKPIPLPKPIPTPGGGDPPPDAKPREDQGPACPKPQDDRPNGPNPSGDEFEYQMSLLINPNNPTPKNSAATPDVTSQAYYLPSPSPDGKTSFDDCKQDDTPTVLNIPDLKPGDMFEMKAPGWDGLLSNSNTKGYQAFGKQVKSQSDAVLAEGQGRQIYYCMGNQSAADLAKTSFKQYPSSHFLVCH